MVWSNMPGLEATEHINIIYIHIQDAGEQHRIYVHGKVRCVVKYRQHRLSISALHTFLQLSLGCLQSLLNSLLRVCLPVSQSCLQHLHGGRLHMDIESRHLCLLDGADSLTEGNVERIHSSDGELSCFLFLVQVIIVLPVSSLKHWNVLCTGHTVPKCP